MREEMGIAIRILRDFAANGQGYSIAGGQGYSNFLRSVMRIASAMVGFPTLSSSPLTVGP